MRGHHAGYAGLLKYLSNEFRSLAHTADGDGRFVIYANVLERISMDLMASDTENRDPVEPIGRAHSV